jgi:hypothetical protein
MAGFAYGGPYPGYTRGVWQDAEALEEKFLSRSEFCGKMNSPVWVGEFGPVYTGDPARDAQRYQILEDQLDIYRRHGASWSLWTYKDVGLQGMVYARPDSAYLTHFGDLVAKKKRLGTDSWGTDGSQPTEIVQPVQDLVAREFPDFDPYPWGRWDWVRTLLLTIMLAQPLAEEYAELFRGLGPEELAALAGSFRLADCRVREPLLARVVADFARDGRLSPR